MSGGEHFTLGVNTTLDCRTDLDESRSSIEWIWHNRTGQETLVTAFNEPAVLELNPVLISMHGTTYTCKTTGTYGIQERHIEVAIEGMKYIASCIHFKQKVILFV